MKTLVVALLLLTGIGSQTFGAESTYEWVKNPLVVGATGCKNFCVGVYRSATFKPAELGVSSRSEASFIACEAVGDGTVCPGATDCKKAGFKLDAAQALAMDSKTIPQPVSESHEWVGHPQVFTPNGCARKLCGGAEEQKDHGNILGYGSPLCEAKAAGQCPSAVNCAYEETPDTKLLRLTRVLPDGGNERLPASVDSGSDTRVFLNMLAK